MAMENIFQRDKSDGSYTKMPNDFSGWQDAIIKEVYKRLPAAVNYLVRIEYKKKDEEKGYAVASVMITNKESSISATIPVVIKEFKMHPLDVFIVNGAFLPLDEYTFKKYFTKHQMFSKTIPRRDFDLASPYQTNELYSQTHPPFHVKQGSVMNEIMDTLEAKDLKNFKQSLMNDPHSFANLASHEKTAALVKKICRQKPCTMEKKASYSNDVICIDRFGFNKYRVLSNSSECFSPKSEVWDYDMLKTAGVMDEVYENESLYKSAATASPMVEGDMISSDVYNPKDITSLGTYTVRSSDGTAHSGSVIPYIIDFNQKRVNMKYFIAHEKYAYQQKIVGVKKHDEVKLEHGSLEPGATGMFVYEKPSGVVATVPFEVISISRDETQSAVEMWARTPFGGTMELRLLPGIKQIIPNPGQRKSYSLPIEMKFVNLGEEMKVVSSEQAYKGLEKVAHSVGGKKLRIINNGGTYSFQSSGIEKYANVNGVNFDMTMLRPHEAKFMLMSFGCSPDSADGLMKVANETSSCYIHNLVFPKIRHEMEKISENKMAKYDELFQHVNDLKIDMVKEAGAIIFADDTQNISRLFIHPEDYEMYKGAAKQDVSETVDALFSLNFINKENIKRFVSMKPALEGVASKLAQLLTASRLGVKNIPSDETAAALSNLSYVIEGLDLLEGSN